MMIGAIRGYIYEEDAMDETQQLKEAIALVQSGRKDEARAILHDLVRKNPKHELAWVWLAETLPDPFDRVKTLEECLRHNPESALAKNGLAILLVKLPPEKKANPAARVPKKGDAGRKPGKPKSRIRSGCLALVGLGVLLLAAGGIWYVRTYPTRFPAIPLLAPGVPTNTPSPTVTGMPTVAPTVTPTARPTATRSPTATATSTDTPTSTLIPTPTIFKGTPGPVDRLILYMPSAGGCTVMSVSTAGGGSAAVTKAQPEDCVSAEISPNGKRIVFVGQSDPAVVYTANTDGSNRKLLTRIPLFHSLPVRAWTARWSPNSQRIAIVTDRTVGGTGTDEPFVNGDFSSLYTIAAGGGALRRIGIMGFEKQINNPLAWSPDGKWIFLLDARSPADDFAYYGFVYRESDSHYNYIAYPDSGGVCFYHCAFDWSPDSKSLSVVFMELPERALALGFDPAQQVITISSFTSTEFAKATFVPLPVLAPSHPDTEGSGWSAGIGARWSPDGKTFLAMQAAGNILTILGLDGTIQNVVLPLPQEPLTADWSPDGKWIYFVLPGPTPESGGTLGIVRPDGSDERILAYDVLPESIVWK
jgi:hypothetical protein